jgi:hypothetical protein
MTPAQRTKLLAASDYLAVAPRVVEVVRTLDLPDVDGALLPLPDDLPSRTAAVAERWSLGSSMARAAEALTARA